MTARGKSLQQLIEENDEALFESTFATAPCPVTECMIVAAVQHCSYFIISVLGENSNAALWRTEAVWKTGIDLGDADMLLMIANFACCEYPSTIGGRPFVEYAQDIDDCVKQVLV